MNRTGWIVAGVGLLVCAAGVVVGSIFHFVRDSDAGLTAQAYLRSSPGLHAGADLQAACEARQQQACSILGTLR